MKNALFVRGALAALLVAVAPLALSHALPKVQQPASGATVAEAPHEVSIEFGEALEPGFSSIAVTDANGKSVMEGQSAVDGGNAKKMHAALSTLGPGTYMVTWAAVAHDGHRTQGHYSFTVK